MMKSTPKCYKMIGSPLVESSKFQKSKMKRHETPHSSGKGGMWFWSVWLDILTYTCAFLRILRFSMFFWAKSLKNTPKNTLKWPILGYFCQKVDFLSIFFCQFSTKLAKMSHVMPLSTLYMGNMYLVNDLRVSTSEFKCYIDLPGNFSCILDAA